MRSFPLVLLALAAACSGESEESAESSVVVVEHILVSFAGTPAPATRTQQQAKDLA